MVEKNCPNPEIPTRPPASVKERGRRGADKTTLWAVLSVHIFTIFEHFENVSDKNRKMCFNLEILAVRLIEILGGYSNPKSVEIRQI